MPLLRKNTAKVTASPDAETQVGHEEHLNL
jgi:hypothetical protein